MMTCEIMLAASLLVPAQTEKVTLTPDAAIATAYLVPTGRQAVDEQIEVMRALLIRKLGGGGATGVQPLAVFGDNYQYQPQIEIVGTANNGVPGVNFGTAPYRNIATSAEAAVEGAYLDGYGVVFTVTMPATGRDPRPRAAGPKETPGLSEWDREQRRLRGEPVPEQTGVTLREPPVGDALLKLLAENGKHFISLKDDERVAIAVTFRASAFHAKPVTATSGQSTPFESTGTLNITGVGTVSVAAQPQSVRDHELLGDLHLKQGQPDSAIEAYRKAVKLADKESSENPSQANTDRHRDALIKLAQAYLAAGREQEGRSTMQTAVNYTGKIAPPAPDASPATKPSATARPARLTISAPKKLLDQVGNGKMSLEEFRKQATVEYVPGGKGE
jgi:hypothetical protein